MHCWYIIDLLLSLLFVCTCSGQVNQVSDITACDGCSVWFTFNVAGLESCENVYYIALYYQNDTMHFELKHKSYSLYNASICNINITIESVPLYYSKFLFHIEMLSTTTVVYSSNYFRIIVQGPPDPVIVTGTLNCTGVLLTWLPPPSLPGCPIHYYTITILELNITNITTSTSIYYLLSDIIISNEIYTVTISATNGASTGNKTMYYFNTSLVPQVILTYYHIEVDPDNPHNAVVMFRAQVIDVDCTPSYPTHLSVNITCEHYSNYSDYNITITNNGSITINEGVHLVCPVDQFNCSAHFIWSNLNLLSNITLIDNFSTYEIQEVIISEDTSTGYFIINCTFLPGSQAKGCAIEVFKDTGEFMFNQNISRLPSTSLYAVDNSSTCLSNNGTYIIYVYIWDRYDRVNKSLEVAQRPLTVTLGCKDQDNISISVTMATTLIPTISVITTLLSTTSTPIWYYIVGSVGGVIILIFALLLCCCCVLYYKRKKKKVTSDDIKVKYVKGKKVTISKASKYSGIPIVSGITSSMHNTGDSSTATSDYSESATLLHNEPFKNIDPQFPSSSGKPTVDDTELSYQSIHVEERSNINESSIEVVQSQVTPVSAKKDPTESISESIVKSEMVAQQSKHPIPIQVEDTGGPSKFEIPDKPIQNPSSEMRQNIVTIPNQSTVVNDPPDKTNQSVSDETI